jgi:hypothetical protein
MAWVGGTAEGAPNTRGWDGGIRATGPPWALRPDQVRPSRRTSGCTCGPGSVPAETHVASAGSASSSNIAARGAAAAVCVGVGG